jgi:hypothetical protein
MTIPPLSQAPNVPLGDGPVGKGQTAKSFLTHVLTATLVALVTLGLWTQLQARQGPAAVRVVARRPSGLKRVDAQPPRPKLSELELLTLQHYVRLVETYLEWGSGASTELVAPLARRAFSIESSQAWCEAMVAKPAVKVGGARRDGGAHRQTWPAPAQQSVPASRSRHSPAPLPTAAWPPCVCSPSATAAVLAAQRRAELHVRRHWPDRRLEHPRYKKTRLGLTCALRRALQRALRRALPRCLLGRGQVRCWHPLAPTDTPPTPAPPPCSQRLRPHPVEALPRRHRGPRPRAL